MPAVHLLFLRLLDLDEGLLLRFRCGLRPADLGVPLFALTLLPVDAVRHLERGQFISWVETEVGIKVSGLIARTRIGARSQR